MEIFKIIENEIIDFLDGSVPTAVGGIYSQRKLVERIVRFANKQFPGGNKDSQGNYIYWYDNIGPGIDSETKNIDFDTKDIDTYSEQPKDSSAIYILKSDLREYNKETKQAIEINNIVEECSGWGNVVLKEDKKSERGYSRIDLTNFYITNQAARTLNDTIAIERHILTQSKLRKKKGVWKNIDEVIENCKMNSYEQTKDGVQVEEKSTPFYEIYERNGEVSLAHLKEARGEKWSYKDEDEFVLAKIIIASKGQSAKGENYVLFAQKMSKMPYKEYHRGAYKGRWWREGHYELKFDIQVRLNEIGNEISNGLRWAGKTIFFSNDKLIAKNIITDLRNGDILRAKDIKQVQTRMEGFDQLANEWNRLVDLGNKLVNSYEIVQGQSQPSGTTAFATDLLNTNANKLYGFIREKLALTIKGVYEDWIIPKRLKELKTKDIVRLTGSNDYLQKYYEMAVEGWYNNNLLELGPHSKEMAEAINAEKIEELKKNPDAMAKVTKEMWNGIKPRISVTITGENVNRGEDVQRLQIVAQMEPDPIRRSSLVEKIVNKLGIDTSSLPKANPELMMNAPSAPREQPNSQPVEQTV